MQYEPTSSFLDFCLPLQIRGGSSPQNLLVCYISECYFSWTNYEQFCSCKHVQCLKFLVTKWHCILKTLYCYGIAFYSDDQSNKRIVFYCLNCCWTKQIISLPLNEEKQGIFPVFGTNKVFLECFQLWTHLHPVPLLLHKGKRSRTAQ